MAKPLTTKFIEAVKADPTKRQELPDPAFPSLYLVVQPTGTKSWALRFRHESKTIKLTLGNWPLMGLADARTAATAARDKIERGQNPAAEKLAAKTAKLEVENSNRNKIKTLVEQFDKRHLSTLKSGREARRQFDTHIIPAWGHRDIQSITKRDVVDLLDNLIDQGKATTANRIRAYLSKFFNWCASRDIIEVPPTLSVKAPAKEKTRDRVLSDDEIRWLWKACDEEGFPWGPAAKIMLLTGQRLNEVVQMTDDEIDGETWRLSGRRTKNSRAHDVPLSTAALGVLSQVERINGNQGFIFTTTGTTSVSGFFKGKSHLAARMVRIASEERSEPVEIPRWTFHDLRRTCATGMARLGIPVRVTEAVLNHVSGTGGGIVAVYQRHDYADEKRQALEAWARLVAELLSGKAENVIRLRGA